MEGVQRPTKTKKKTTTPKKAPTIPARTLEECFDDVAKIAKKFKARKFSKDGAAAVFDVKASAFTPQFTSMKEFGLVEKHLGEFRVAKAYTDMQGLTRTKKKFREMALAAVKRNKVFDGIRDTFDKLPSMRVMVSRLKHKNVAPDQAEKAVTVLRESLSWAGLMDSKGRVIEPRDGAVEDDGEATGADGAAPALMASMEFDAKAVAGAASMNAGPCQILLPLAKGRRVLLAFPADMTKAEAKRLANVLLAGFGVSAG
ncbi:MAG: hypothetical protein GWQ08_11690 [Verrucomicrobiaceae bacterium]|nr:hypothetical protein [Verrucomicrobiaceae bacterium]